NTTMTRVNGVYETDFAITMVLIANTDDVIYTNAGTDPYGAGSLNTELQSTLTSVITEANYDIGHLVHQETNSNGNAGCIGCVCVDGQKGSGFTSHVIPTGDNFDIDYVAHEMGHQFGGNHTFTQGFFPEGTGAQLEPGSGSTIMGYAGITGASDVQAHSDDYFHYFNIEQITNYVSGTGCQTTSALVNAAPVTNAGNDYTIPHSTAFILEGNATDADAGDILTYCWEQGDEGFESKTSVEPAPNSGMSPSFRSLPPTISPYRYMPKLIDVVAGNLTTQWETVQTQAGIMNFALTVRDNVNGGGQNNIDKMMVTVDGASGPFEVTSQSTNVTWTIAATETVTWNVANTTAAPVSTPNVDIFLSIDGGLSFWKTLALGVPNNGSANITVPWNTATNNARVMIRGAGNIFYAVNSTDFTIFSPTGISEIKNGNINIYPNPTSGLINLEFKTTQDIDKISISDLQGKIVYLDKNITISSIQIDLNSLSNGVYMLQVQSKNDVSVYKVIKQ
ncbi:MAG: zinc-dependent metalloprotease, partial [Flavobacteriales bacterium]|nr:zinc-dependent metalloprotease [Flavobacteriales bacterium]